MPGQGPSLPPGTVGCRNATNPRWKPRLAEGRKSIMAEEGLGPHPCPQGAGAQQPLEVKTPLPTGDAHK